jgi:hypothetical protein
MRQKVCWKARSSILTFLKVFKFTVTKRVCICYNFSNEPVFMPSLQRKQKKQKKTRGTLSDQFDVLMFVLTVYKAQRKERNFSYSYANVYAYTGNFFSKSLEIVWKSNFIILIAISILCSMEIIRIHYGFSDQYNCKFHSMDLIANFIVCFTSI